MATDTTSMTLTGVYSGFNLNMTGSSGLLTTAAGVTAKTGYKITREIPNQGKPYNLVSVVGEKGVTDPPSIIVSCDYAQEDSYAEVDLDIGYTDIPSGTSLQVECSQSTLNISKQQINGTAKVGSIGTDLGPFQTSIVLRLWVTRPDSILKTSALTLNMSKIEESTGGPVKKVLLERMVTHLAG